MTPLKNLFFFVLCFWLLPNVTKAQYISVNDTYSVQRLVEDVLINSPCANVSNFSASGHVFGINGSYGYFSANGSSFPFADGIILSTGKAISAIGPNNTLLSEGPDSWLGDTDLESALELRPTSSINATVLEFDFMPFSSSISFDYIFSSEQYLKNPEPFQCDFTDGFAFLLREAGTTNPYLNLAIIPGTTTPVRINTVRGQSENGNCAPMNENYFGGFNANEHPTDFNGQTVVMKARATVIPGKLYHIKLVVADEGNRQYDSAIFLGGNSFNIGTYIGDDRLIRLGNPLCNNETVVLNATETGATAYKWYKDNVLQLLPPLTSTFTVSTPGTYRVEIYFGSATCFSTGQAVIEYSNPPAIVDAVLVQCDPDLDGSATFNLKIADAVIKNSIPDLGEVTYYETLPDAQNLIRPITNLTAYTTVPKTIYAAVANAFGCYNTAKVMLQVSNNGPIPEQRLSICDLDPDPVQDGIYEFNLSNADALILTGLPTGLAVQYYRTEADALLAPNNSLGNRYRNTTPFNDEVYAKIVNGAACYGIVKLNLEVLTFAPADFDEETVFICPLENTDLAVANTYYEYEWTDETGNILGRTHEINVSTIGAYAVKATATQNGCTATKKFIVKNPETPIITSIDIKDVSGSANSILINYTGNGSYEFSVDGILFQDSPYFSNLSGGNYTAIVKNKCQSDSQDFYVLDYPRFFSPNGDGYNDFWNIAKLENETGSFLNIYDRYGKLLKQISAGSQGWDGTINAKNMPADDYWFMLTLQNGRIIKGHFSLKR